MSKLSICDLCGERIAADGRYIVRIDVFGDPSVPPMTTEQLAGVDGEEPLPALMKELEMMSADELQDAVHRRFEYQLCIACHRRYLANPLGRPRSHPAKQQGRN